ncbi:MAG: glycoside hydrolase family 1 protein [Ardenticatenia bacterium]|nr:glycoside hydrolase family 1 protein [Ardenticatenia bacterium]
MAPWSTCLIACEESTETEMTSPELHFPEGFLWGTATSSHQVEGGNVNNDWWLWEHDPGHIHDHSRSGAACEWWCGRAEEDVALAARLGQNAHRLSVEWSRLEPAFGVYDPEAFARYRRLFEHMRALGVEPMVTLHHFTLPRWAAKVGGWTNRVVVQRFSALAAQCARRLGDLVTMWCTINEPVVLVYNAYAGRQWPPGTGRFDVGLRALRHLLRAHAAAYHAIHDVQPEAQVGMVFNMPLVEPARPGHPLDRLVAFLQDWVFNEVKVRALREGRLVWPLAWPAREVVGLREACDFVGLNYYGRYLVRFAAEAPGSLFGRHVQEPTVRLGGTDWGQVAPAGLTKHLLRLRPLGVPLYVTENGVCDAHDTVRPHFLVEHVRAVHRAIQAGADVRGYFHWSLVDNFEWAEGWSARFGLLALNPFTQERLLRQSAEVYAHICRTNSVPADSASPEQ